MRMETPSGVTARHKGWLRHPLAVPLSVLVGALAFTIVLALYVGHVLRVRDARRFDNAVEALQDRIQSRLRDQVALLRGTAALFAADADVDLSRQEFHDFVSHLDVRRGDPGLQAIGFALHLGAADSEAAVRRRWLPDQPDVRLPAAAGPPRDVVVFVEALDDQGRGAVGVDLAGDPALAEALGRAADSGEPSASARTRLPAAGPDGFLVCLPVYRGRALPATVEARRAEVVGFVFGVFRADELLRRIHGTESEPRVAFEVYDGAAANPAALLYRSAPLPEGGRSARTRDAAQFVYGRPWTLRLAERRDVTLPVVPLLLGAGGLTSVLLFVAMLLQARGRVAAEFVASTLRRNERNLRQSESRFRTLIERLPAAVSVYVDNRVIFCNPAMMGILHARSPGEIVGAEATITVVPEDRTKLTRSLAQFVPAVDSGPFTTDAVRLEVRHLGGDGEPVPTEGFLLPILFDGQPAVLGLWEDVTQRRELAARMMQMDRMIAVGTLAAGVAHEINNPLAYVMANLEYAVSELAHARASGTAVDKAEITQALVEAKDGAERMRRIVRDLKTYSRSDDEKRAPVDLLRAIEWAVAMAENEIRHRARLLVTAGEVPLVEGDEGRLGQVFLNLLVNAAQAIPEGAADKNQIRVTVRPDPPGKAVVEVFDTGVGIPPEVIGRIFDPFFTTKPIGVGTGLGLAISQRIVTDYGGELRCESQPGRGTTFRVTLPAAHASGAFPVLPAPAPLPPAHRPRVLVIDDEVQVLRAIQRGLASTHDVVAVARSKEALERLRAGERFDAILCDLMMPEMTGMELHAQLLGISPEVAARMVFITGGAFTPRARQFLDQVKNPRLEKPFDLETLRQLLQPAAGAT